MLICGILHPLVAIFIPVVAFLLHVAWAFAFLPEFDQTPTL